MLALLDSKSIQPQLECHFKGVLQYRKGNQVINIPTNAFVPFEVEPTYNRIGTVTISDGGNYELRLRSEYRYDWNTDSVKFQYVEGGVTYEKTFQSLLRNNQARPDG